MLLSVGIAQAIEKHWHLFQVYEHFAGILSVGNVVYTDHEPLKLIKKITGTN